MNNKFVNGLYVQNGSSQMPSHSFISQPNSGMYLINENNIGISSNGIVNAVIKSDGIELRGDVKLGPGATNAILMNDSRGFAKWDKPIAHGSVKWNSVYNTLALNGDNELNIAFNGLRVGSALPSVQITKESSHASDVDFYIKNKTNTGFTIYSKSVVSKKILSEWIGSYKVCRLSNGDIGICYYDTISENIKYIYSVDGTYSAPITIDMTSSFDTCAITLVNGNPAIVYLTVANGVINWQYIRALDVSGSTWGSPVSVSSTSGQLSATSYALRLLVVNNLPIILMNNDIGRAKYVMGLDVNGDTWNTAQNVSNLTNHQLLDAYLVDGEPAIIAKSNITSILYYVRATSNGTIWPIGATQINKLSGPMLGSSIYGNSSLEFVDTTLCIFATELSSNHLYVFKSDNLGETWTPTLLASNINTSDVIPTVFKNNDKYYLVYNTYIGTPSNKVIMTINPDWTTSISPFLNTLDVSIHHRIIKNINDNNNTMIISSDQALSTLAYFADDFVINWVAHSLN